MRVVFGVILIAALSGCGVAAAVKDPSSMSDLDLCRQVRPAEAFMDLFVKRRAEAEKRGLIKPSEWELIEKKLVKSRMSECAVIAAYGMPEQKYIENPPYRFGGENHFRISQFVRKMERRKTIFGTSDEPALYSVPLYVLETKGGKISNCVWYRAFVIDNKIVYHMTFC